MTQVMIMTGILKTRLPIKRCHLTENIQDGKRFTGKTYTCSSLLPENSPENNHENHYSYTEDQ
jgi:hypothetical protein